MSWLNLYSAGGCLALVSIAWLSSANRRIVDWRSVGIGLGVLAALGALVFWLPAFRAVLLALNEAVNLLLSSSAEGAEFLFGPLAGGPDAPPGFGAILAFTILPAVIFFSVLAAWLYHVGVLPALVRLAARAARRGFRLSGAEALSASSNVFFGVESALVVRPFLSGMTRSELMMVLTAGLSSIASTVLAIYVGMLRDVFPYIAGHLISASVLSIPAAVVIAKIMVPEDGSPVTRGSVPPVASYLETRHWMGSIVRGAMEGVRLAVGIGALLIGMLGLVALADLLLSISTGWLSRELLGVEVRLTVRMLLEWLAYPLVALLGLSPTELPIAARLIGQRWLLTEIPAYQELAVLVREGALSPRGLMIVSYSLCGFTHVASVAIFVGGISALAPDRRDDLAALSWRALWAATLATLLTGAVAGAFYYGQVGLIS
jgi:concentrative nucleoside transporter, CNT family